MTDKVEFSELLLSIKSTRNVNEVKRKLENEEWLNSREKHKAETKKEKKIKRQKRQQHRRNKHEEEVTGLEEALEKQKRDRQRKKLLDAPIHRQAQQRIESKLSYRQTKQELGQWQPIVDELRTVEQLQFPHDERHDNPLRVQTAEERAKGFIPRTELEMRITEVLAKSKSNIPNDQELSQAEQELLKSMNLAEARRKCEELRKMRALISFNAAKFKRQSKIKSKLFHRVKKRQKRRELLREVETMFTRDPEQAAERAKELDRDRAYERATLKHRGTSKWTKQVKRIASRNPELRQAVEDQLRLGREIKTKHLIVEGGKDSSDDDDDNIDNNEHEQEVDIIKQTNIQEMVKVATEKAIKDDAKKVFATTVKRDEKNPFMSSAIENIRRECKTAAKIANKKDNDVEIYGMNTDANQKEEKQPPLRDTIQSEYLNLNLHQIIQIPKELIDGASDGEADPETMTKNHLSFLAEAYEDDDVIDDFRKKKSLVEEEQEPSKKSNQHAGMRGWGAWTGPGITEQRELKRIDRVFDQPSKKRKQQQRKDARMNGIIIRENVSEEIRKLQPKDVPFPFTRIQDFETYIQQPLGRDWNTPIACQKLTQPSLLTKPGRIIRPLDKKIKMQRKKLAEIIDGV